MAGLRNVFKTQSEAELCNTDGCLCFPSCNKSARLGCIQQSNQSESHVKLP